MELRSKILGSLIGSGIGDSMGSVTETYSPENIRMRHGGPVREYRRSATDNFSRINWKGAVTDDFSLVYIMCDEIIKNKGIINDKLFENVLVSWADLPQYFIQAGPTSRDEILRLKGLLPKENPKAHLIARGDIITNGTSMKSSPLGLINPGNIDQTIEDTIKMCKPTHPSVLAVANGAAISCAVSHALTEKATKESVIQAAIEGSRRAYELAKGKVLPASGARIDKRIEMAVEIALKYGYDFDLLIKEMTERIGVCLLGTESTAAVFGYLLVAKNADELYYLCVNSGGDADTVATMAGAVYGALYGAEAFDPKHKELIEKNNFIDKDFTKHYDLDYVTDGLLKIAKERGAK